MANNDTMNAWALIQQGVKDTERLIGHKEYNMAMMKARQTLEFMVKCLAERADIPEGDLIDTIDILYRDRAISKSTCEHYHKIRMIGNKAAHDGDDNAYNANQAYHLLSQEVYTFASDYTPKKKNRSRRQVATSSRSTREREMSDREPRSESVQRKRTSSSGTTRSSNRRRNVKIAINPYDLLKILIPLFAVILVIAAIKLIKPGSDKETMPIATEMQVTVATTAPPETTTEAVNIVWTTTNSLNVRSAPSTDGDKLATLPAGTVVDYVEAYDDAWAVINYNGAQAYVSSQYLKSQETESSAAEDTSESATESAAQ